jgi:hypothetical protein
VKIPVDESEFSLWALEGVGKLFRHSMKELVLLHVVDPRILRGGGGRRSKKDEPLTKDISKKLEAAGRRVLTDCAHRMEVVLSQAATKPFTALKTALVKGTGLVLGSSSTRLHRVITHKSDVPCT